MPIDRDIYSIHAVRLLNFHNVNHVILPVSEGGHLFLLGDNGSGKTTVLDAIHYVLSAGEMIELNSAARLGGNKQDGRRIHGAVLRINVETGALCPEGRVTYAALELRNAAGHTLCIGIGLSIAGANSPLQQWGFRMDCAVADLPLLGQDASGHEYPLDREEFKKLIQKSKGHYYMSMNSFSQALSRDFFPGRSQYDEYRKFLNMCKAYREISSRAGNYHELFKSLLPEPEQEIIRDLRLRLKELRDTNSTLTALDKRCEYLRGLYDDKQRVDSLRGELGMLNLGVMWFERQHLRKQVEAIDHAIAVRTDELHGHQASLRQAEEDLQEIKRTLTDLQHRDPSNLTTLAHDREQDLSEMTRKLENLRAHGQELGEKRQQAEAQHQAEIGALGATLTSLSTYLAKYFSSFPGLELLSVQTVIQNAQSTLCSQEPGCFRLSMEPMHSLHHDLAAEEERLSIRCEESKRHWNERREAVELAENDLSELQSETETLPGTLPRYSEALHDAEQHLIPVSPLYLKLHWRSSVSSAERSAVEELIGESVLGTLVTESCYCDQLRKLLVQGNYGGLRCASLPTEKNVASSPHVREFLDRYFDSEHDVLYLVALAHEFAGSDSPVFSSGDPIAYVNWRGSYRVFHGTPAKLIGEEARRAEHQRRMAVAKERLAKERTAEQDAAKRHGELEKQSKTLQHFAVQYKKLMNKIEEELSKKQELEDALQHYRYQEEASQGDLRTCQEQHRRLHDLVVSLQNQVRELNLQTLEADMAVATQREAKVSSQREKLNQICIECHLKLQENQEARENAWQSLERQEQDFLHLLETVAMCRNEESLVKYMKDRQLDSKDRCTANILILQRQVGECVGKIKEKINAAEGIDYGFSYDEDSNELYSREHRTLEVELNTLQTDVSQQKEILTEQARKKFEAILLEGFRESLRNRIYSLEEMHAKINRMLKGHQFGRNTYSLKIEQVGEYAPLVRVMKSFSDQTPESSEDLKQIFDRNADEILNAPATCVPDILDYRNYFSYKMLLHVPGDAEKVMDGRTKSVGSGGEQAVPNYLLVMMIAHLLFEKKQGMGERIKINTILFDEAFYGIDQQRQDQLLAFAEELGLQLVIASPNQDGMKLELAHSTNVFVRKDTDYNVHFINYSWRRDKLLFAEEDESWGVELPS